MPRLFCLVLISLLTHGDLSAQAWTQNKGALYSKLSYGAATASEQYSFDGTIKLYADNVDEYAFFDRSLYLYAEYGLSDKITLVGTLPYKRVIVRDAAFRYKSVGLGSIDFGVRYSLKDLFGMADSPNALAVNLTSSIPSGYHRNYSPSLGAGQLDLGLSLNYGRSFYPSPSYAQAGIGYKHRSSAFGLSKAVVCQEGVDLTCFADNQPNYSDELVFSSEGGYTLRSNYLLQFLVSGTWSFQKPETGFSVTNPIPTRQRYIKTGLGLRSGIGQNMGLSIQSFWTAYGRNTVRSIDLFIGIDYSL